MTDLKVIADVFGESGAIIVLTLIASAVYWRLYVLLKKLQYEIEDIKSDRKSRWECYDKDKDSRASLLSELREDIKELKTDNRWVKETLQRLEKKIK
jgi:hypothetical protein